MTKKNLETKNKKNTTKQTTKKKEEKVNIFTKIGNFIKGVKTEFKRIKWPTKKELIKYSVVTIIFIIFCALFFYLIDIIIAALHSLFS
ncbi:MAG TPA: preprotein translocase subunit SecE [Candidatus Onthousia faecavium]|mgnify:CR=1 FL=1|nr:preprotein translocase subunit SecE [Candidatus Onthousia faecavium]